MEPKETLTGSEKRADLSDLAIRVVLAACLWLALHLLAISEAVAIVTIAAIFGPSAIRAGWDRGSSN